MDFPHPQAVLYWLDKMSRLRTFRDPNIRAVRPKGSIAQGVEHWQITFPQQSGPARVKNAV